LIILSERGHQTTCGGQAAAGKRLGVLEGHGPIIPPLALIRLVFS